MQILIKNFNMRDRKAKTHKSGGKAEKILEIPTNKGKHAEKP